MKKNLLLPIILLTVLLLISGCKMYSLPQDAEDQKVDIEICYVKDGVVLHTTKKVNENVSAVADAWLKENSLDARFTLKRALIYTEDLSFSESYKEKEGEVLYKHNGYWLYFSEDLEQFFLDDESGLYRESFVKTMECIEKHLSDKYEGMMETYLP